MSIEATLPPPTTTTSGEPALDGVSGVTDNEDLIKGDAAFRQAGGPSNRAAGWKSWKEREASGRNEDSGTLVGWQRK